MCIYKYYALILCAICHNIAMGYVDIQGLPAGPKLVTMKKTIINDQLASIDILFKKRNDDHYYAKINASSFSNQATTIQVQNTEATFFSDSYNDSNQRSIVLGKTLFKNNVLQSSYGSGSQNIHNTSIVNTYTDKDFFVTQSDYPTIRFWENNGTTIFRNLKEISQSFLLGYTNKHAVWAKKQLLNKNMLDIYIGFEFGTHSKSWILKKDVYNFLVEKNIFSVPLINKNVMPACFIEQNTIALYNDTYKKIDIFKFIETTDNNKRETKIDLTKTIKLSEILHEKNMNLNTFLLYKTPFKIDYDATNNSCILLYNDLIVKINLNTKTFSVVTKAGDDWIIADSIIYEHKDVYVLWHRYQYNTWHLVKYVIQ